MRVVKVAVMQPYLLPYIGYWQLLACVDRFVLFDDVHFPKKGYVNRNYYLHDGERKRFTLALRKASQNKLINQLQVGDNRQQVFQLLIDAYRNAPYVDEVRPLLEQVLLNPEDKLARYLGQSIMAVAAYLGVETEIRYSSGIDKPQGLRAQEKVLDLAQRMGADCYVNAIGGQDLYQRERFREGGMELKFLQPEIRAYAQDGGPFVPNLSLVDVLMFNDRQRVRSMLQDYSLI